VDIVGYRWVGDRDFLALKDRYRFLHCRRTLSKGACALKLVIENASFAAREWPDPSIAAL
jgi:hypothetical protein